MGTIQELYIEIPINRTRGRYAMMPYGTSGAQCSEMGLMGRLAQYYRVLRKSRKACEAPGGGCQLSHSPADPWKWDPRIFRGYRGIPEGHEIRKKKKTSEKFGGI